MSHDHVLLDLLAIKERYDLFNTTFPSEALNKLPVFDSKLTPKENLLNVSHFALNEPNTSGVLFIYKSIFLEIISNWTTVLYKTDRIQVFDSVSKIITIYPLATSLIEEFLDRENDYFLSVLQNPSTQGESNLQKVLLSYYRLLFENKEAFVKYVKPDILYSLISEIQAQSTFSTEIVKFLAIKILSIYLDMGEKALLNMIKTHISSDENLIGSYETSSNINYKFLEINEAKRFSNFSKLPESPECFIDSATENANIQNKYYTIKPQDLNPNIVSICGVLVSKINSFKDANVYPESFVPTLKTITALRKLAKQLQYNEPVMLVGQAGAGKTFLINEASKYIQCHDSIVKIHLGEQTDAKLLIGTYTSGEKPGTFEWRSGVLTTAVKEGRWVLIEDIDKAPTEVLSILLSLLEKRELTIPSRGETVKAANGFQLISTVRVDENNIKKNIRHEHNQESNEEDAIEQDPELNLNLIGMRIWNTIYLHEPSETDLHSILCQKYPVLARLIPKLIHSYKAVKKIYHSPKFISLNRGAHARVISVRDLMKLCNRLGALFENNNITKPDQLIELSIYDSIFAEASDCFAGAISEYKALEPLIHCIGETLEITPSRISLFLSKHVPTFENLDDSIKIGRSILPKSRLSIQKKSANSTAFAITNHSLRLMEQIAVTIQMTEPVLLVGETGTGKTTVVQQMAKFMNKTLTVINVSQQTETGDLLGGYKPVNSKTIAVPIQELFETLFIATFSLKKNERFSKMLHKCFNKGQWKNVVRLWQEAYKMAQNILKTDEDETEDTTEKKKQKKRKLDSHEKKLLLEKWVEFYAMIGKFELQSSSIENAFVFNFVEGSLVKAVRNGEWLLLDEVNLASADTLESISDLLSESSSRSILLSEKGDAEPIRAHPDFRIFACMNPATDVGKRDLPSGIRSRFTEIYVHSPDRDITDLLSIIDKYIGKYNVSDEWVGNDIAELYLEAKKLADSNQIVDGSNQKPHFSIRTLTRTLLYVGDIVHIYGLRRSLYDGFCMSFLTLLDQKSESLLEPIIMKYTLGRLKNVKSVMGQIIPSPGPDYVQFNHYWMKKGQDEIKEQAHYIITPFVKKNMMNLVRASSGRRFPVLVQGPTSAGKTSMIKYLADITGHKFVRINNHEHTDLQEYLGTYITDETGKLSFREGILVEALRKGYWIVLDELNLAPTDVLEALNRLLDDNRELFIPETQEVVHPHPDFMLFATQNPPGLYGGRKVLSRAFRNRFLELHFDDIPQDELETILRERCQIAPTYAKKIVEVYRQLSIERSASRLFEQKNSFATLRDLFRWALREAVGYEELAANGYMLLAERCRNPQEKVVIKNILEKVMKVKLDMQQYYTNLENKSLQLQDSVVWTNGLRRLSVLVSKCLQNNEPVLLVGETGCGKTTICQILSAFMKKDLITLNAHQNTETGDILGAQRPIRNRSELQNQLANTIIKALDMPSTNQCYDLETLLKLYKETNKENVSDEDHLKIKKLQDNLNILFEWSDGPLITALKTGNFFLLDEISLADDSVLERLNSVLEPERNLLLAEKGTSDSLIVAKDGFQFLSTMNPGGDYGKKELSPALRNRFTEIWVPSMENFEDVHMIVESRLLESVKQLTNPVVKFSKWFGEEFGGGNTTNGIISLRDILAWVQFINSTSEKMGDANAAFAHGASMVFIDALGTNNTAYLAEDEASLNSLKKQCLAKLSTFIDSDVSKYFGKDIDIEISMKQLRIGLFSLNRGECAVDSPSFNLNAPTTATNLMRVVRAMQVHKPILLEGSPGVGKTSLITALADLTGNNLTRINLSEQTDLVDLFGSDAPGEKSGEFVWKDAPFLRAMQQGSWILLDEMNLASQSVLEGLNACLDHRGEAYIPELDRSFSCHPNFLVFAAQNPQYQGGGRKGLPKSFVNRFSVVYVDMLTSDDLLLIAHHLYPNIDPEVCSKLITLMSTLERQVVKKKQWGSVGAPWEFNLRDTLRWLKLLDKQSICEETDVVDFVNIIIKQRFRSISDKEHADHLIKDIFGDFTTKDKFFKQDADYIQVNNVIAPRNGLYRYPLSENLIPLECNIEIYESALMCINNNWPLILVGPSNSGKSAIIRTLANILGTEVGFFSMNSDVDSMDILGGYEQVDITRKISYIVNDLKDILRSLLSINMGIYGQETAAVSAGLDLFYFLLEEIVTPENFQIFKDKFISLLSHLHSNEALIDINERITKISKINNVSNGVTFEWFDGMLVKAVEKGHWLVLDNANLCSPSVLDRLNSLLETDGTLLINECSEANGEPRVIKPHPNFRLFLTVDPKYGELSRAMRNRGVELFVQHLETRATVFDSLCLGYPKLSTDVTRSSLVDMLQATSLNTRNPTKPTKCFIPSHLSYFGGFMRMLDMMELYPASLGSESLVTVLPLIQLRDIQQWTNNALSNAGFTQKDSYLGINNLVKFLAEMNIIERMDKVYSKSQSRTRSLLANQNCSLMGESVFPLLNVYLLPTHSKAAKTIETTESIYMLTVSRILNIFTEFLNQVNMKSIHGKIDDLSYMELSAASANGRHIKNVPRIPIFNIICRLCDLIIKHIKNSPLFEQQEVFSQFYQLVILISTIIDATAKKDEARLRVYKELLVNWVALASDAGLLTTEFSVVAEEFDNTMHLNQGQSITILWDTFRKKYPYNEECWSLLDDLVSLCNRFDEVETLQFSESYESLNNLRTIFGTLYECLLNNDTSNFKNISLQLEEGLETMETLSSKFLVKRKHFFRDEYDTLLRLLYSTHNELPDLKLNIVSFTSLSTYKFLQSSLNNCPYPSILGLLWTNSDGKFQSEVDSLTTSKYFENIITKSNSFGKYPGSQIKQILSDAKSLLSFTAKSASCILESQMDNLAHVLTSWIKNVITAHVPDAFKGTTLAIKDLDAMPLYFKNALQQYLLPAMELCEAHRSGQEVGRAWILFSIGLITLYVPDIPYDPAVRDYVLHDVYLKHKEFSQQISSGLEAIRITTSGDEQILAERLFNNSAPVEPPQKPRIFRPTTTVDNLFDEWKAFLTSTISADQVNSLMDSIGMHATNHENRHEMFQQNTSNFLQRLESGFKYYSDLNEIFAGYILSMKLGFDILKQSSIESKKMIDISTLWPVDPLVIANTNRVNAAFTALGGLIRRSTTNMLATEKILIFFLQLFKFHESDVDMLPTLNSTLHTLYYRWSLRRLREEQNAEQKASLFKYEDTSEDFEADFKKMFPDYEDTLTLGGDDKATAVEQLHEVYYAIAENYMGIFGSKQNESMKTMIDNGSDIVDLLLSETRNMKSHNLEGAHLTAVISRLSNAIDSFKSATIPSDVDFYRDSSISESQKAIDIIDNLWKYTHELLKQWPEHATLNELFRICGEFLDFPIQMALARQLQKIEQIYTFMAEWEKYASSQVSLASHIKKITDLIVSWRKLELHTWNSLFNTEDEKAIKSIGKWWFYLFETIIVTNFSKDTNLLDERNTDTQLLESLNVFFSKSTLGEFETRLKLVESFIKHIELMGQASSHVSSALSNVITFYRQFLPTIQEQISRSRKTLEKDISEVILLASWKDVNVDALKQSSRRSHNSLYKYVRKYRDLISGSVLSLIENGLPYVANPVVKLNKIRDVSYKALDLEVAIVEVKKVNDWSSRPAVLQNINMVNKNMNSYSNKISEQAFPNFVELAVDFNKEADRLRQETPSVFTKDNKKKIAALKAQKGKLLSDALKELRRIGLKSGLRKDIHAVQGTSTAILANSCSFSSTELEGSDTCYYRVLDILPRLRGAVGNPADDIPFVTLEKGMAISENLVFSLITIRKPMATLALRFKKVTELRRDLEDACSTVAEIRHRSLETDIHQMLYMCTWLPRLIDYVVSTMEIISGTASCENNSTFLLNFKEKLGSLKSKLESVRIIDSSTSKVVAAFTTLNAQFISELEAHKTSTTFYVYDVIISWINQQSSTHIKNEELNETKISEVDQTFRKIFTSIILVFQKLMENGVTSVTEEMDNWLSLTATKIMFNVKTISSNNVIRNIEKAVSLLKTSDFTAENSSLVRAIVTFTMPVINHYYTTMQTILDKSRNYYSQTSHGTYILTTILYNLAKNGFCSPEPPSEEVDDKNLHEGTGLGDGEGAQNNTKDIEQDEDLTEDAQTENKDQENKDDNDDNGQSDEDEAVEMEGDMAGDLENISDQEEKDEDIDSEEEDNELDEEIDDINEDDPNAIDDKMWDEEPEEDSKEKNTDQNMNNKSEDQDIQAADEENNEGDNADNGENEGSQDDDNKPEAEQDEDKTSNENDNDEAEEDEDAENEEDVGEQEDEVKNEEGQELDAHVPEVETMDLPEDMNLDSGDEDQDEGGDGGEEEKEEEEFGDNLDNDENEEDENINSIEENEKANDEDALDVEENEESQDGMPDEDDAAMDVDEANEEEQQQENTENPENVDENMSEDEQLAEDQKQESKEQGGEENADGLDGVDDMLDEEDIDAEAAVQQNSGSKGVGSDAKDDDEQEDIGNSGATQIAHQEEQQNENEVNEPSREEAKEALKQLGDSLRQYHKRHQEIKEASNDENQEDVENVNQRPDEFEHVEGTNTENDTQALGAAAQDQLQSIDQDNAIEDDLSEKEDEDIEMKDEVVDESNEPVEQQEENNEQADSDEKNGGVFTAGQEDKFDVDALNTDPLLQRRDEEDELDELMDEIDNETHEEAITELPPRSIEESRELWHKSELATADLVSRLGEQLRLILEPTLATKLKGDYKTGKRLNMKRIIPYIASQFRKDKIWLRRTKPSKREYQIMIAIDDSKSMSESKCVKLAFDSLCLVSKTLTQLESGGLSIVKFGQHTREVHPFQQQFSNEAGAKAFQWFNFQDTKTDVKRLVAESIKIFERARAFNNSDQWQLEIVISDGICEDHETVQRLVRRARENKIMLVFVIIDGINNSNESIMDMSQVNYIPDEFGNMKLQINKYLDSFPFEFYVILHDISELPEMLSLILRQYFSDLASG
ncbi:AAA family ATPase midasin NDAI_0G02760 [Naumovozyma dairenensis CBS 421]|uniref:Midasin n=1 Tax=Naumovozyma dairenensis (strain ATCC 10597 / BCRC 20456 / CBS 421 / NBRC 0211 / NRRL Y-12639) TaxID=1071378 RepID=G0WE42_NAUDC|nr:hypothetical protein NDAI_0G02760 [Naumovozyma dairenensis CBS 421]CCD26053.2 hypothetical protein NDAI_0G02760 [Naumovozyma dairenensis CBS 421]